MNKDIVKWAAFCFETDFATMNKRLIYDSSLYSHFQRQNVDFKTELIHLLLETEFMNSHSRSELNKLVSRMDFSKRIVFNYNTHKIMYEE